MYLLAKIGVDTAENEPDADVIEPKYISIVLAGTPGGPTPL